MENKVNMALNMPEFLSEYSELKAVISAEEPEFQQLWAIADSILYNQFITTADEDGIDLVEKLLGIFPDSGEALEERRVRVLNKWLARLPYTYKAFLKRVAALCGENFTLLYDPTNYLIEIQTHLREYGRFAELKRLILEMLPANIYCKAINSIVIQAEAGAAAYSSPALCGKRKRISVNIKEC